MPDHIAIKTQRLSKHFQKDAAVDGLDLEVGKGQIFGLVGPDGSGKTTTIRLLAAIMDPTAGQAMVAGFDTVQDGENIKRLIGYMAQRFNLYRDLSVLENLNFYADIFEVRGAVREKRLDQLLKFAGLDAFKDRRAAHLSGGMQKKLALACTLIHRPEIIFLDEPTTGVDPVSRREFWDILSELHVQGITLFISTPYMDEAERCSRVGLLYKGKLLLCDTPERIKKRVSGDLLVIWPSQLQRSRQLLESIDSIIQVQTYGRQLRLVVADVDKAEADVRRVLTYNNIQVLGVRPTAPRMEEAYISLVAQADREGHL